MSPAAAASLGALTTYLYPRGRCLPLLQGQLDLQHCVGEARDLRPVRRDEGVEKCEQGVNKVQIKLLLEGQLDLQHRGDTAHDLHPSRRKEGVGKCSRGVNGVLKRCERSDQDGIA